MFLKRSPESEVEIIEDRSRILKIVDSWQRRILRPEYILIPPLEEGDITMWDNWVGSLNLKLECNKYAVTLGHAG